MVNRDELCLFDQITCPTCEQQLRHTVQQHSFLIHLVTLASLKPGWAPPVFPGNRTPSSFAFLGTLPIRLASSYCLGQPSGNLGPSMAQEEAWLRFKRGQSALDGLHAMTAVAHILLRQVAQPEIQELLLDEVRRQTTFLLGTYNWSRAALMALIGDGGCGWEDVLPSLDMPHEQYMESGDQLCGTLGWLL